MSIFKRRMHKGQMYDVASWGKEKSTDAGSFPYSNCSIAESSLMLLDIIKNTSGVQAAVESHRNENVVGQQELLNLLTTAQQRRLQMPNEG